MSTGPSSGGPVYGDNSFQLPHEQHTDALYLSHVSPVIQFAPFPSECSPDTSPDLHRRSSLPEDQLQSIYLDTEVMRRYFPVEPDFIYGLPLPSGPLQPPMYTVDSSAILAHDTTFVGDHQAQLDWTTQSTNDVLMSPQEPMYSPFYGYNQSDSAESVDIHPTLPFPINTYDSFEFQTLREHHMSAVPASQHA